VRSCKDPVRKCKDAVRSCKDPVRKCKVSVRSRKVPVRSCKIAVRSCRDAVRSCKISVRSCKVPVRSVQNLTFSNQVRKIPASKLTTEIKSFVWILAGFELPFSFPKRLACEFSSAFEEFFFSTSADINNLLHFETAALIHESAFTAN
jgi:hypothetical protein